eukprot:1644924-Amphidinium_carterae.1
MGLTFGAEPSRVLTCECTNYVCVFVLRHLQLAHLPLERRVQEPTELKPACSTNQAPISPAQQTGSHATH